ncbi:monocarboxylate transporter 12 isoform X1 [Nematostella vectensis]|uniref:monocarboxylate transporter 12 isoform X1 n=2 Tax=Nematostella vectensis TaxID=45351 RepID=UPI002077381D|nr:monocarboxylate transporter 12 isoform X1 [Nematostella vectensis]
MVCMGRHDFSTHGESKFSVVMDHPLSWLVCLYVVVCMLVIYGCSVTYGIIFPSILEEFQASRAVTAFPGAIALAFSGMFGPLGGHLTDRYGCRVVFMSSSLITIMGLVSSSFVPNIVLLYFTYGFVNGLGGNLMYISSMMVPALYFKRRRMLATAFVSAGPGAGLFIMSPIVEAIHKVLDWRKTLLCLAGLCLVPCLGGWGLREKKEKVEQTIAQKGCRCRPLCDCSVLRNPMFVLCTAMTSLAALGHCMPIVHLAKHCAELGISRDLSSWLYFAIGLSSVLARMCCGKLAETGWISLPRLFQFGVFGLALGNLLVPLATDFPYLAMYSVSYGFGEGFFFTPIYCIILESLPTERRGSGYGIFQLFISIPYVFGPSLSGLIADVSGTGYTNSFFTAGAIEVVAGCVPFLIPFMPTASRKEEITVNEELIVYGKESVV